MNIGLQTKLARMWRHGLAKRARRSGAEKLGRFFMARSKARLARVKRLEAMVIVRPKSNLANLKAQKKAAEDAAAEAAVSMGAGDLQAKKDAKAEGSYLDEGKGSVWVEGVDPVSGKQFWKNKVTGEMTMEDPKDRVKTLEEMSPEERKHHDAMVKRKAEKEAKKKGGGGRGGGKGRGGRGRGRR